MNSMDERIAALFAAFEREQDPAKIHEALEMIEAVEWNVSANDETARQSALSHWLRFLAALDQNIDPRWDPKEVPAKVVPHPPSQGVVFPSGEVDPSSIPDPVARAEYVQRLKKNQEDNKRYFVQHQLRRIEDRAMRIVEQFLAERYANAKEDWKEFEELLSASPLSDARKKELRACMEKKRE